VSFFGDAIVDGTGSGGFVSVDTSAGTQTNTVLFSGLYLEAKSGMSGDLVIVNNARNVRFHDVLVNHNGSPSFSNCFHITGGNTDAVEIAGRANGSSGCTDVINNGISGYVNTTLGAFDYHYTQSGQGTGTIFDGLGVRGNGFGDRVFHSVAGIALPTCTSATAGLFYCVSDATTCTSGSSYTGSSSTGCLYQCNAAGSAYKATGVSCQ
jgi:hypothetical protein